MTVASLKRTWMRGSYGDFEVPLFGWSPFSPWEVVLIGYVYMNKDIQILQMQEETQYNNVETLVLQSVYCCITSQALELENYMRTLQPLIQACSCFS